MSQNRSSFFFWQCCKTCFIVAVLQHRLCCKTSCVAKPHVLRISCPQHYMLFGSLLRSKILWPIILHNRQSEAVLQNRLSFFLTVLQNLLCCSGVAAPAVLQNQLCSKTACAGSFRMLFDSLLNSNVFWTEKPDCSARAYDKLWGIHLVTCDTFTLLLQYLEAGNR